MLAFAEGRLSAEARQGVEAHALGCMLCQDLLAAAIGTGALQRLSVVENDRRGRPERTARDSSDDAGGAIHRGATIGRYTIIGLIGRGGMGEVFAAHDPELDRKVALKLLRAGLGGDRAKAQARLLREAKTLAKLSHANVVTVHDAGTFGDLVFVAMEFVDGVTLTAWLAERPRARAEILAVFVAAARGLAAAHDAGLVHRDFKPENVMIDRAGAVRVMDFGLARELTDAPAPAPSSEGDAGALSFAPNVALTTTGQLLGTPLYMAPEQFRGETTDARTDQFSFCVALYRALYVAAPFGDGDLPTLVSDVLAGRVRATPPGSSVPGWTHRVLLRGLATDPAKRFESMNTLLRALEANPTARWRRVGAGVAVVALVIAAGLALRQASLTQRAACRGGGDRWSGVWEMGGAGSARKDAIRRAFLASGRGYSERTLAGIAHAMDDYVRKWVAMYTDACEATHLRSEQSTEVLDLRMSCLNERLTSASALSDLFAHADGTVVDNALSATSGLPALDSCADVVSLKAVVKPPANDVLKRRVEALGAETARLSALRSAGHCRDAAKLAETLLPRVRDAGYLPLLARTLIASGRLSEDCLEAGTGIARYKEAYTTAVAARDDATAAEAAIFVMDLLSDRMGEVAQGREWLEISAATLRRFDNHPTLDMWLLNSEGILLINEGRGQEAVKVEKKVIAAKERQVGPDDPDVAMSWNSYGNALMITNAAEAASQAFSRARDLLVRALGPDHLRVALVSSNLGEALNAAHHYVEARAAFARALDVWRGTGADEFYLSYGLTGMGVALVGEGRPADAIAPLEDALRIRSSQKVSPELIGETRFALARALWSVPDEWTRARALAREARAECARTPKGVTRLASIDAWLAQLGPTPARQAWR